MRIKLKKYYIKNLLDKYENIIKRCHLIEKVSKEMDFIPETKLTINDPFIIYEQNLINKKPFRSLLNFNKKKLLLSFAHNLDLLNKKRFVHGDLNITNIIYDGNKLNLIDIIINNIGMVEQMILSIKLVFQFKINKRWRKIKMN